MEIRSFNSELCLANLMFKRIFSNIVIERATANGPKHINVNCVLGLRSRILKNLQNADKRGTIKLPLIAINRTGYTRNGNRLNNMNNEVKYEISKRCRNYNLLTPVPIDITYDVVVMSKLPSDIDLIASNFMVVFNSNINVSCNHPKFDGILLTSKVIMQDSVSEEHLDELDGTQDDFVTTTFQFTFLTFLFGGTQQYKTTRKKIPVVTTVKLIVNNIDEIMPYEIDQFLQEHPNDSVSAILILKPDLIDDFLQKYPTSSVSAITQTEGTSSVTSYIDDPNSDDYYETVPIIKKIDFGFYVAPMLSDINEFMTDVDTNYLTHWPYVDRICWYIDDSSQLSFPNNICSDRIDEDGYYAESKEREAVYVRQYNSDFAASCMISDELGLSVDFDRVFIKPLSSYLSTYVI